MDKKSKRQPTDMPAVDQSFVPVSFDELFKSNRVVLESDPISTLVADFEKPRKYFEAITDSRLWWIRELQLRPFEPWAKFWFQNRVTAEIIYTLMSNVYKYRFTPLQDLAHGVISTESTVKDYIKQAQTFDLVSLARDKADMRRILVRVTRRSMISYENQLVIEQAMELAIRLKYAAHTQSSDRRQLFKEWQEVMSKRRAFVNKTDENSTIDTAHALRRVNLEFDAEFYPRFVGKNVHEFTKEFTR